MNRFVCILLTICLILSPGLVQPCPTCYGKQLIQEGAYKKKELGANDVRKKVLAAMKQEKEVLTQEYHPGKKGNPQGYRRHKIGSSSREVQRPQPPQRVP